MIGAGALQLSLTLFVVSLWPEGGEGVDPTLLARIVIYDFFEKLLFLVLLVTPLATASAFASERERSTLHLLRLTNLTPMQIVAGKLVSALGYMLLLLMVSLPFLALLLSMGGVAPRSILLLYGFFAATIVYTGLIGMLASLLFRSTLRAVAAAYAALFLINVVLPSVQLAGQYVSLAQQGVPVSVQGWPTGENLYSTPGLEWYYIVDVVSPLSVYLNFRFVQLRELVPSQLAYLEHVPAGDFRMVYHFFAASAVVSLGLLLACARRLERLTPRAVGADKRVSALVRGEAPADERALAFFWGAAIAIVFARFLNDLDVARPKIQTLVAMAVAGIAMGGAGARAISSERERDTLDLVALTGMSARRYLRRATGPALQTLRAFLFGYGAALLFCGNLVVDPPPPTMSLTQQQQALLVRSAGQQGGFNGLPPPQDIPTPPHLYPLGLGESALSVACVGAFGLLALAIGVGFSSLCRATLAARASTTTLLAFLWFHWTALGPPNWGVLAQIESSRHAEWLKTLFKLIAFAKIQISEGLAKLNPFVWLDASFGESSLWARRAMFLDEGPRGAALLAAEVAATVFGPMLAGLVLYAIARRRLASRQHFA